MEPINFNSVESLPGFSTSVGFTTKAAAVFAYAPTRLRSANHSSKLDGLPSLARAFREDCDISPTVLDGKHSYMPWGADNLMPYNIIDLNHRPHRERRNAGHLPIGTANSRSWTSLMVATTVSNNGFALNLGLIN